MSLISIARTLGIFNVISLLIGLILGWLIAVKMFDIDVDLLGVPYFNKPVATTEAVVVKQGNLSMTIPKGATLVYRRTAFDRPHYFVLYISTYAPFGDYPFTKADEWEYFMLRPSEPKAIPK